MVEERGHKRSKKTRYCRIHQWDYKDRSFCGGLVKDSPHKVNKIYLSIGKEWEFHFTYDETFAILNILTQALWCSEIFKKNKKKAKLGWSKKG